MQLSKAYIKFSKNNLKVQLLLRNIVARYLSPISFGLEMENTI